MDKLFKHTNIYIYWYISSGVLAHGPGALNAKWMWDSIVTPSLWAARIAAPIRLLSPAIEPMFVWMCYFMVCGCSYEVECCWVNESCDSCWCQTHGEWLTRAPLLQQSPELSVTSLACAQGRLASGLCLFGIAWLIIHSKKLTVFEYDRVSGVSSELGGKCRTLIMFSYFARWHTQVQAYIFFVKRLEIILFSSSRYRLFGETIATGVWVCGFR